MVFFIIQLLLILLFWLDTFFITVLLVLLPRGLGQFRDSFDVAKQVSSRFVSLWQNDHCLVQLSVFLGHDNEITLQNRHLLLGILTNLRHPSRNVLSH